MLGAKLDNKLYLERRKIKPILGAA